MIVLDTNVVSEFMTSPPSPAVRDWMNAQEPASLYITAISIAEISFGLHAMPQGQRRRLLEDRFERFIETAFPSRVLHFDEAAARIFGEVKAHRRQIGGPVSDFDGQIASIARVHGSGYALSRAPVVNVRLNGMDGRKTIPLLAIDRENVSRS